MAVPVRVLEKKETIGNLGEQRAMHLHKPCRYAACLEHGVTSLGDEDLCCDHFVLRCYEFLEQVDTERTKSNGGFFYSEALKNSVTSCLHGALEVSLQAQSLNNLQKARLMDILLWAGELVNQADSRSFRGANMAVPPVAASNGARRAAYVAPQVKTKNGTLPQ